MQTLTRTVISDWIYFQLWQDARTRTEFSTSAHCECRKIKAATFLIITIHNFLWSTWISCQKSPCQRAQGQMCPSTGASVFLREGQMLLENITSWQWHSKTPNPSALLEICKAEKTWALTPQFSPELYNFFKLLQNFTSMEGGQRPCNDEICTKTKRRRCSPCSVCWQSPATPLLGWRDPTEAPPQPWAPSYTDASPCVGGWACACGLTAKHCEPRALPERGQPWGIAYRGTPFAELETRAATASVVQLLWLSLWIQLFHNPRRVQH